MRKEDNCHSLWRVLSFEGQVWHPSRNSKRPIEHLHLVLILQNYNNSINLDVKTPMVKKQSTNMGKSTIRKKYEEWVRLLGLHRIRDFFDPAGSEVKPDRIGYLQLTVIHTQQNAENFGKLCSRTSN